MQNKLLIIQQYFGLGDIIWGQTIANDFIKGGYKVVWPVMPQLAEGLNRAYPNVLFIDYTLLKVDYENKNFYEIDGVHYLPMRYSESLMSKPYKYHMESKYSFLGKDWRTWKEGAVFERSRAKEQALLEELGIKPGDKFNLVSTIFGSKAEHKIDISVSNGFRNIEMVSIEGYSLFDWAGVMERAAEIHAVSSATLYLFEILDIKSPIHLYVRKPIEQDFSYVDFLFSKPYILHK